MLIALYDQVAPPRACRTTERLDQRLLRREPRREGGKGKLAFTFGEQALAKAWGSVNRALETREVNDIHPNPDDHGRITRP